MAEADDLETLVIPSSVKLAGAMLIGAGITVGIVGLQVLGFRTRDRSSGRSRSF